MKVMTRAIFSLLVIVGSLSVQARTGEQIFNSSCVSCHGRNLGQTSIPILFGQEKGYIEMSLQAFKSGARKDNILGVMHSMALSLTDEEISSIAKYLVAEDICSVKQDIDPKKEGFMKAFRAGADLEKKINCQHCHGSFHHSAPRLYGQKKEFIKLSLNAFKDGRRKYPMMERFAGQLSDEDIENLATYLNGMVLMRQCQ